MQYLTRYRIPVREIEFSAVRSQGPGGQNVNKVASAIQLRFDIAASSLRPEIRDRLLALHDHRITRHGEVVIKAQESRSQEINRTHAVARLEQLIDSVAVPRKRRIPTRPTRSSQRRRLDRKTHRGHVKSLRGKPSSE